MQISKQPIDEIMAQPVSLPKVGQLLTADECQAIALCVAYQGMGNVSPNPMVGAVFVDSEHKFLAAGAHLQFGKDHAEANALNSIKQQNRESRLNGATVYVTLEPCAHQGNTPSCAKNLVNYPLKKVVYAQKDPNPQVDGQGAKILEDANILVELDEEWGNKCNFLTAPFFHFQKSKGMYVGLKSAQSLDGSVARSGDQRAFITGKRARQYGHFLRNYYDAVVVGRNTLVLDNPKLDARNSLCHGRDPWRIVIDSSLRGIKQLGVNKANLLLSHPEKTLWVVRNELKNDSSVTQIETAGAKVVFVDFIEAEQSISLKDLHQKLISLGIYSLLLEGGANLYTAWLNQGFVQRLHLFVAPSLMMGSNRVPFLGANSIQIDRKIDLATVTALGDDILIEGDVV